MYLGTFNDRTVAIKVLRDGVSYTSSKKLCFEAEFRVKGLEHPNVVRILEAAHVDGKPHVVMEYIANGTLESLINNSESPLNLERRLKYAFQISSGLLYIHLQNIIHLDLKPSNILISSDDCCKLGDFGSSKLYGESLEVIKNFFITPGTVVYCAPELFCGKIPLFQSDIYSFAITLWQMKSQKMPFQEFDKEQIIVMVVKGQRPYSVTDGSDSCYRDLYERCWNGEPLKRPTADELVSLFSQVRYNITLMVIQIGTISKYVHQKNKYGHKISFESIFSS